MHIYKHEMTAYVAFPPLLKRRNLKSLQATHRRGEGGALHVGWRAQAAALESHARTPARTEWGQGARGADRRPATGHEDAQLPNAVANDFDRRSSLSLPCSVWSSVVRVALTSALRVLVSFHKRLSRFVLFLQVHLDGNGGHLAGISWLARGEHVSACTYRKRDHDCDHDCDHKRDCDHDRNLLL
jgi:hypothetical protein